MQSLISGSLLPVLELALESDRVLRGDSVGREQAKLFPVIAQAKVGVKVKVRPGVLASVFIRPDQQEAPPGDDRAGRDLPFGGERKIVREVIPAQVHWSGIGIVQLEPILEQSVSRICQATRPDRPPRVACHSIASA